MVTLVADKLRKQWLWEGNNSVSNLNQNHTLYTNDSPQNICIQESLQLNIDKAGDSLTDVQSLWLLYLQDCMWLL